MNKVCKICGSAGFSILERETRFKKLDSVPGQYIVKCDSCSIVTRTPSLFSKEFDKNATVDVRHDTEFIGGNTESVAQHLEDRLAAAEKVVRQKTLLDVGCGSGSLLVFAREQGWDVYGTEMEPACVAGLERRGIPCYAGALDMPELRRKRFDLIHLNHVFEHVEEPLKVLSDVKSLLKADGLLIMEVPNEFSALSQRLRMGLGLDGSSVTSYFQHEWFFTPTTLRHVCQLSGMKINALKTPFRPSGNVIKDGLRFSGAKLGLGEVIEVTMTL